jgi:hypothetical protein
VETYGPDGTLELSWSDVDGKGFRAVERTAVFDNERPSATFVSNLALTNTGSSPIVVQVFHYLDVDVPGNADDDRASRVSPSFLRFSDLGGSVVRYRASNPAHFQVASYPALRDALNDASLTDLSDTGVPLGPTNVTAAYQWSYYLDPGVAIAVATVSVSAREAGDFQKGDYGVAHTGSAALLFQGIAEPEQLFYWSMRRGSQWSTISKRLQPNRRVVGIDDFNRDGTGDLVEHDASTGLTYVRGAPVSGALPAPFHWRISATGDFDGDGYPDIVWRSSLTQKILIWRMQDNLRLGDIVPVPDQAADANWAIVAALDFDGSGTRDLLWYNTTSGKAVLWFMDAQVRRTSGTFTTPDSAGDVNWKLVAAADYGKGAATEGVPVHGAPDLVWRNATSGKLVIWHMNLAGQRTSGGFTTPDGVSLDYAVVGPR